MTFAVAEWVDIFSRRIYADKVLESLKFCISSLWGLHSKSSVSEHETLWQHTSQFTGYYACKKVKQLSQCF